MKKYFLFIIISLSLLNTTFSQNALSLEIKYLSAENVFINGGIAEEVNIGDCYSVIQNEEQIAEIEVLYVANHSASCKILKEKVQIQIGDKLSLLKKGDIFSEEIQLSDSSAAKSEIIQDKTEEQSELKKTTKISGNIRLQFYHFEDLTESKQNFNQPTLRFNLRMTKLWNKDFNIKIKLRSKYNERSILYNNDVPRTEWRNRVYEASFSYDNPSKPINFQLGRIISNAISGIGYVDGLQLQYKIKNNWLNGFFAGLQPDWQTSELQTSIQKYGIYSNYVSGDYSSKRWESTLALTGEYHGSTISREFLYLQNSYSYKKRLDIYQSLELDLNRAWRKEKTNESLSISGLYISTSYKLTSSFKVGLSYDNRKNFYNYEIRSIADSLFNSAFRQGIRANFNLRLLHNFRLYSNLGWSKTQDNGSNTYSYVLGINKANLLSKGLNLTARFNGFTNYYTDGYNPSIEIGKSFLNGQYMGIGYGSYIYVLRDTNSINTNHLLRLNSQIELPLQLYFSGSYEYDWGSDVSGYRILAEIGYRF